MIHKRGPVPEEEIKKIKASLPPETKVYKFVDPNPWKDEQGNLIKDEVIFKLIDPPLYSKIQKITEAEMAQDKMPDTMEIMLTVCTHCVLWPQMSIEEWYAVSVGYISTIAKNIQEKSGFIEVDIQGRVLEPAVNLSLVKEPDSWDEPSAEVIERLKETCPFALYKVTIDDSWVFIIRPMDKVGLDLITEFQSGEESALDQLADRITIWPEKVVWDNLPVFVPLTLINKANDLSGFVSSEEIEVEEL